MTTPTTTVRFLDKAIKDNGLQSDLQLAKALHWSNATMSHYRTGKRVMGTRQCLQLARYMRLSDYETIKLIMLAEIERSGQLPLDVKEYFGRAACWITYTVLTLSVLSVSPNTKAHTKNAKTVNPSHSLQIMQLLKRWFRALRAIYPVAKARLIGPLSYA